MPTVRWIAVLVALIVLWGAACTSESPQSTTSTTLGGAESPEATLATLVDALTLGDSAVTGLLTFDDQLALLIGLEGSDEAATVAMLDGGVPDSARENFWRSFANSFPAFAEEQLMELRIGSVDLFSVEGLDFGAVAVALSRSAGSGKWITRKDAQGRWRLDLFATFGAAFARPLREWLAGFEAGADKDRIRAAVSDQRASLLATLQREPFGPVSPSTVAEVDALLFEAGL